MFPKPPMETNEPKFVISDIIEHESTPIAFPTLKTPSGFPTVSHRSEQPLDTQQARVKNEKIEFVKSQGLPSDIHEANIDAINSMTSQEIMQKQQEIYENLPDSMLKFLKTRALERNQFKENNVPLPPSNSTADVKGLQETVSTIHFDESNTKIKPFIEEWVPPDMVELEKLSWISSVDEGSGTSTDKKKSAISMLRFDFKGFPIDSESKPDIPLSAGLHHHGDDPQKAGYTIQEILYLCRSTVPAQRVLNLQILGNIIKALRSRDFPSRKLGVEIEKWLLHLNYLLYIRSALNDSHETVFMAALTSLAAFFDVNLDNQHSGSEESSWDELLMTRMGTRSFAISRENTEAFKCQANGTRKKVSDDDEENRANNLVDVIEIMKNDCIKGLLSTNVILSLCLSLEKYSRVSDGRAHCEIIIRILIRFARHSLNCAIDIVNYRGLLNILSTRFICLVWPPAEKTDSRPLPSALKLLRLLAQSNRKIAETIIETGILDGCMRFIVVKSDEKLVDEMKREAFNLLNVVFSFKLASRIVDEYRSVFVNELKNIYQHTPSSSLSTLKTDTSFLRMMVSQIKAYGHCLSLGGSDDSVKVFVQEIISWFGSLSFKKDFGKIESETASVVDFEFISSSIDIILEYSKSLTQQDPSSLAFAETCFRHEFFGNWISSPIIQKLVSTLQKPSIWLDGENKPMNIFAVIPHADSIGLSHHKRVSASKKLLFLTSCCDVLSSLAEFSSRMAIIYPQIWRAPMNLFVVERFQPIIIQGIKEGWWGWMLGIRRDDWLRVFGRGWIDLQKSWLESSGGFMPIPRQEAVGGSHTATKIFIDTKRLKVIAPKIYQVALNFLSDLLPGDEMIASRILNTCLLGESWRTYLGISDGDKQTCRVWIYLRDFYEFNLWDERTLAVSNALYGRGEELSEVQHLLIDLESTSLISLPVPNNWMYSPIEMLIDKRKLEAVTKDKPVDGSTLPVDVSEIDLVLQVLKFVYHVDTKVEGWLEIEGRKGLYLRDSLTALEDNEVIIRLSGSIGKLVRLMNIFLLSTADDQEVFHVAEIKGLIEKLSSLYITSTNIDGRMNLQVARLMESAAGGQMKFYNLYRELVSQYMACSFGDASFTRMIMFPLIMGFSPDYRTHFWGELSEMLRKIEHLPWLFTGKAGKVDSLGWFLEPVEDSLDVLSLYSRAIGAGYVSPETFLGGVVYWHVSHYLFDDMSVGSAFKEKIVGGVSANEGAFESLLRFNCNTSTGKPAGWSKLFDLRSDSLEDLSEEEVGSRRSFCRSLVLEG